MHATALSLPVVLPEAILALGTLALVLYGALRGERAYNLVTEISVALLGVVFIVARRQAPADGRSPSTAPSPTTPSPAS